MYGGRRSYENYLPSLPYISFSFRGQHLNYFIYFTAFAKGTFGSICNRARHANTVAANEGATSLLLSCSWTAWHTSYTHSLPLGLMFLSVNRQGIMVWLQDWEESETLPFAHAVISVTAVAGMADSCFLSALCWTPKNSRMRQLQYTVSRNFSAYSHQTVQLALDFHGDSCHCCKLLRTAQGHCTVTVVDYLPSTGFILTDYGKIGLSLKTCFLMSLCSPYSVTVISWNNYWCKLYNYHLSDKIT